ncbi:MAG: hypothetical protein ACI9LM_003129 [Alteromonadaceae bacterium]|jgi:hypothetical protein
MYLLDFLSVAKEFRHHNYPVNQLFGVQNGYPSFMEAQHQVNSIGDAENSTMKTVMQAVHKYWLIIKKLLMI